MDDLTFLRDAVKGTFKVITHTTDGKTKMIYDLDYGIIKLRCPALLTGAEDQGHEGIYVFENKSLEAVISLLRHIYLEDYTYCEAGLERPCSLLLHLQVYELARMLGMVRLQYAVFSYILDETDRFRETQSPIHGFYEGIAFLYTVLRDCKDLRTLIADYCVNHFGHFHFADQELFRQTAFGSPMFHKDLQQANVRNEFRNEAADKIVQLPVCDHWIHTMNVDFACQHHSPVDENGGCTTPTPERIDAQIPSTDTTMALRPLEAEAPATPSNPKATLAVRPKTNARHLPDSPSTPSQAQAPASRYWRDTQPSNASTSLQTNKRMKLEDPRTIHQTAHSSTLVSRLWDVLGDKHDYRESSTTTADSTDDDDDDDDDDDKWTKIKPASSSVHGKAQRRGGKQKWIVGAEEEDGAGGAGDGEGRSVSSESEWSLVSTP